MQKLIDIAGRTGQAPVRALLADAVGFADPTILQPVEIRYRNDQHHVIYGLYEGDTIVGLIGLARNPAADSVEILHVAVARGSDHATVRTLLGMAIARQRQRHVIWNVPGSFEAVALELGFSQPEGDGSSPYWELYLGD